MDLTLFNRAPAAEAEHILRPCVDIPRWSREVSAARPFDSVADLLAFAQGAASPWSETEIDGALAHHPRIGERAAGDSAEASMSRREQAAVATSGDITARLLAGNRAYEEKFGRVFLIRAAGRSAEEILQALEGRLQNSREEELPVIAGQLREIAILRLEGIFEA